MKKKSKLDQDLSKLSEQYNLPEDFFKQFKSKEDLQSFFESMIKGGIESLLRAELDEHLGYEKHSPSGYNSGNSRNGYRKKKVKTSALGDLLLSIPRDRESTFESDLIPKHSRM